MLAPERETWAGMKYVINLNFGEVEPVSVERLETSGLENLAKMKSIDACR
jgi:hypothetical protein